MTKPLPRMMELHLERNEDLGGVTRTIVFNFENGSLLSETFSDRDTPGSVAKKLERLAEKIREVKG